ncbi:MAG TPA: hypothetical protein VF820_00980, partial [Patescibacteria group bacterium]
MKSLSIWENIVLAEKYFFENRRIYNFLLQNPKKIKEFQLESIKKLVNLAYTQTTFYNQLYKKHNIFPQDIKTWEDFYKLPTITKEDIMQNSNEFIVNSRKHDKNLFLSKSSGSSGKIIEILFEGDSWIRQAQ